MTQHLGKRPKHAEEPAIHRLATRMPDLSDEDWYMLRQVPVLHRFVGRGRPLIRDGEQVSRLRVICKGWAIRYIRLDEDRRQILDFVLPGDVIGLHMDGRRTSTCDVEALTPCEVGEIELNAIEKVAQRYCGVANGLRAYLTRDLALANDQVLRLGRMTAYERVCSLLLDIYTRQRETVPPGRSVDFPISQTVIADALGLSVVHVNRQVMQLRREGLVTISRRQLTVHDEAALADLAGYRYRRFSTMQQIHAHAAE